eukprot:CAMPEP_0168541722 /NCGR_PEP_ID=MMETSP0413-20121227/970_1 /TAXON_ID=136452 /ORGANISM="Filamoeba nolandi, Strain NC-AS-23-1" /LENGTH=156 /DNA_ID=CAMNT_0008571559 /DNA_START=105 /DNA_END=572 /DNA_ORIENTATION=+
MHKCLSICPPPNSLPFISVNLWKISPDGTRTLQDGDIPVFQAHKTVAGKSIEGTGDHIQVEVQNHSQSRVFVAVFVFTSNGKRQCMYPYDAGAEAEPLDNGTATTEEFPLEIGEDEFKLAHPYGDYHREVVVVYVTTQRTNYSALEETEGVLAKQN